MSDDLKFHDRLSADHWLALIAVASIGTTSLVIIGFAFDWL